MEDPGTPQSPQLTLTTEFSRRGLLDLRDRIDGLLGELTPGPPDNGPEESSSEGERAAMKVRDLWDRLGPTSRQYLMAAARASADDEFVLDHIAERMSVDVKKVKAYHRNVARSAAQAAPVDQLIFESRREGSRTRLRMPSRIRSAVLAKKTEGV